MKATSLVVAGLALAILSSASANAAPANATPKHTDSGLGCSAINWPNLSPEPCKMPNASNYEECRKRVIDIGWTGRDAWWFCSSVRYKN